MRHAGSALADALAVIFWNKQPVARYLRGMLRDVPELLADLDFYGETKRGVPASPRGDWRFCHDGSETRRFIAPRGGPRLPGS